MITLLTLSIVCLVAVVLIFVVLAIIGLPLLLLLGLLPWLLRIAGVVLLVKALFDKPVKWENFMPAIIAFVLSAVLGDDNGGQLRIDIFDLHRVLELFLIDKHQAFPPSSQGHGSFSQAYPSSGVRSV